MLERKSESVDDWRKISFKKKVVKKVTWCEITLVKAYDLVSTAVIFEH